MMPGPMSHEPLMTRRSVAGDASPGAGDAARGRAVVDAAVLPAVAVVVLVKVRTAAVPWLMTRLVLGARLFHGVPGLRFARVLGSGQGGGFVLRPGLDHGGLFLLFDDEPAAEAFIARSPRMAAYRAHADECLVALLRAASCRGSWGGQAMGVTVDLQADEPVAVLTRGSIRPSRAWSFWRHAAPSQRALQGARGCRLAAGLGEAPLLRQCTFSLWDDTAAMEAYARHGAHRRASASATQDGHFSESMFLRLVPLWLQGRWQGVSHG